MKASLSRVVSFALILFAFSAASAWAQPTISNITPGYGGAGPNSPTSYTITGTGFSMAPKGTRFIDATGRDLFSGLSCSTTTTCTGSGIRPFLVATGIVSTIQVSALTSSGQSPSGVNFIYYGALTISNVTPNVATNYNSTQAYTIFGGPFALNNPTFPGTTMVALAISIADPASCGATSSCAQTAPSLTYDCCVPQGAKTIDVRSVGGSALPYFTWGAGSQTPAVPSITGISPASGPQGGGNTVTITGTNFIPGTQVAVGGFGVSRGTHFTFITLGGSLEATSVNCASTTTCTAVVPSGAAGPADIVVNTVCGAGVSPCSGNARPSVSISTTKSGLYAYPGIKVNPGGMSFLEVSENGGQVTYQVSLYSQPTANVHVAISVNPGGGTTSPTSLDFTPLNWAEPQTVTVTGLDDGGTVADVGFSVRNIGSSADPNYNGVETDHQDNNVDNDIKRFVVSRPYGLVTTRTGGSATFTVVLTQMPSATVTVKTASNDPFAGLATPTTLTFTTGTWNVPQTVTVTGQNDSTPGVNHDYTVILTSSSGDTAYNNSPPSLLNVQLTNIEKPGTPSGLALTRTGPGQATVRWNPSAGADYYRIKYSTTPGGAKTLIASSALPGQTVTGLTTGQQYYFVISALNGGGQSVDSPEVSFIIPPPAPFGTFVSGDNKAEMTYYKANGDWKILNSVGGFTSSSTVALGGVGYTPVPGDYDGDGIQDVAVYNDATGAWNILKSSGGALNLSWGGALYRPVPGDYDGDGKTDLGVYRLSSGTWAVLLSSTNYTTTLSVPWGGAGYVPVPGQDFDGDGRSDIAVYSQSASSWYILKSSTNYSTTINKAWGGVGYSLVPGDYDGDGKADLGLYKRSTGTWSVLLSGANYTTALSKDWGGVGFFPVAADFDGDGKADIGAFQVLTGNWYVLLSGVNYTTSVSAAAWGTTADQIVSTTIVPPSSDVSRATDFDNDGKADITVYNPTSGGWSTLLSAGSFLGATNALWGSGGTYTGVPGDYDGDGRTDRGLYQQSTGNWTILLSSDNFTTALNKSVGGAAWVPVPGDYDGDGKTDFVVYNSSTGQWYGLKSSTNYTTTVNVTYGGAGYTPITGDFDGDGKTDLGVYQPSTGNWSILLAAANYTTSLTSAVGGAGYIPAPGDFDGDGKTDFTVYNPSTGLWYGLLSGTNYTTTVNVTWGGVGYAPAKGDYDGDGRTDLAVYVPSTGNWYILLSGGNYGTSLSRPLGGPGYLMLPKYP